MSLDELKMRKRLAELVIGLLEKETDPRAPAALVEYRRQRDSIAAKIAEIERPLTEGQGQPPPVVVGLKPARLFGNTQK